MKNIKALVVTIILATSFNVQASPFSPGTNMLNAEFTKQMKIMNVAKVSTPGIGFATNEKTRGFHKLISAQINTQATIRSLLGNQIMSPEKDTSAKAATLYKKEIDLGSKVRAFYKNNPDLVFLINDDSVSSKTLQRLGNLIATLKLLNLSLSVDWKASN